jgi:hypothetical protein
MSAQDVGSYSAATAFNVPMVLNLNSLVIESVVNFNATAKYHHNHCNGKSRSTVAQTCGVRLSIAVV